MLIVGELINSSRKVIKDALECADAKYIQGLVKKQVAKGVDYIDVNCGTRVKNEEQVMRWLVETILEVSEVPLCIDSSSGETIATGLAAAERNGKQQIINSITAETKRFEAILPIVQKFKTKVVALCMDDQGLPKGNEDRIRIVDKLVVDLIKNGVPEDDIYLDPLAKPISTGEKCGLEVFETIQYVKKNYPDIHTIVGLSNISFGLPNRKVFNRAFMVQSLMAGMDSFILDPLDCELMDMFYASIALLGKDAFCAEYLKAFRLGMFGDNP